jgi:digeranylgeranylglycerophospholipid reductase
MAEYDVVVVGAGPGGSAAGKVLAEQGLDVIILEEHEVVGEPIHCSGIISATTRPEVIQEILASMPKYVLVTEYKAMRVFAPSGKMVQETSIAGTGACLVERDVFDREMARQAAIAGAELRLNTRVTGLLKKDGMTIGVTTSSSDLPNVYGKVVIAADGIRSVLKGIPKWTGLAGEKKVLAGVSFDLAGVKDIDPNAHDLYIGAFNKMGWCGIAPRDDKSCMSFCTSMAEFEQIKAGKYLLSRKLKDAFPVRMTGWSHATDIGAGLPKVVDDGLMLIGSAANLNGILYAIVTGRYAAEVAIEAIKENDMTAKKLSKYEDMYKPLRHERGFVESNPFYNLTDEQIEKRLIDMIEKGEFYGGKPQVI